MIHTAAFQFNSTNTGAGVFVTIPALSDSFLTTNPNGRFLLPPAGAGTGSNWRIGLSYAMGATLTLAQIVNATLRQISLPMIYPTEPSATVPDNVRFPIPLRQGPILPSSDEFGVQADAAAIEVQTAILWLHDGVLNANPGPIYSIPFTAAVATAAGIWGNGQITLGQVLPVGRYQIVGMAVRGVNAAAARIVFPYGGPRPGCLCSPGANAAAQLAITPDPIFRCGGLGSWGEFDSVAQPSIDILGTGTTTVQTGVLDIIKVR